MDKTRGYELLVSKKKMFKEFPPEWLQQVEQMVSEQPFHRTALEYLVAELYQIGLWDAACLIDQAQIKKIPYQAKGFA